MHIRKFGPAAGLAVLALVGMLVLASAPRGATPPAQTYAAAAITSPSASGTATATIPATRAPARKSQPAAPQVATPTDTPAPAPTATDTPAPQPTATPTPPPTPTPTPAPTWHTVGSWSGSTAGTAGQATVGSYDSQWLYTCAATTPAWQMNVGYTSALGPAGSHGALTCDGTQHTLDVGAFNDNPGGNGTLTYTVSAYTGQVAAWTLVVQVLY